ncbi:hypothetical protein LT493_44225 [Streptomyces tricolor]|nr:hypothetical protein [Streptomyces tricolor]
MPAITAQLRADQRAADTGGTGPDRDAARPARQRRGGPRRGPPPTPRRRSLPDAPHAVVTVVQVSRSVEPPGQVESALRAALGAVPAHPLGGRRHGPSPRTARPWCRCRPGPCRPGTWRTRPRPSGRCAFAAYLDASAAPVVGIGGAQDGLADAWTSHAQARWSRPARPPAACPTLKRASARGVPLGRTPPYSSNCPTTP